MRLFERPKTEVLIGEGGTLGRSPLPHSAVLQVVAAVLFAVLLGVFCEVLLTLLLAMLNSH